MRSLLYSFPVKLVVLIGAIVAAAIIVAARTVICGTRSRVASPF